MERKGWPGVLDGRKGRPGVLDKRRGSLGFWMEGRLASRA